MFLTIGVLPKNYEIYTKLNSATTKKCKRFDTNILEVSNKIELFLTLKLPRIRSKFKTEFNFIFLSKLQNFCQMFSVAIHSHFIKEKMSKFKIPRKNQHWVYFYHSNLKVGVIWPSPGSFKEMLIFEDKRFSHQLSRPMRIVGRIQI